MVILADKDTSFVVAYLVAIQCHSSA